MSDAAETRTCAGPASAGPELPPEWEVPAFRAEMLAPRRTRYACVIPVINEGERLLRQLAEMQELGIDGQIDVILADGGSRDGSTELARLRSLGLRGLLVKTGPGRLSAQLRMAYAWVMVEGYEGVITIDGNGKDGPDAIPRFIEALDRGVDYAQASRFRPGGVAENTPLSRLLAVRMIYAPVCSLAARTWLTDTTQGFRAYSRRYLLDPRTRPFRSEFDRYELLAYLTVRASRLGYRVEEIATRRSYPRGEPTPTKISALGGNADLIRTLTAAALGHYAPKD